MGCPILGNLRFAEAHHCFRIAFGAVNPINPTRICREIRGLTQSRFFVVPNIDFGYSLPVDIFVNNVPAFSALCFL